MIGEATVMKALRIVGFVVISLTVLPATTWAQSGMTGLVRDASGGALPGVTVEAASPALIEGSQVAVTNSEGRYRFVDLRAGTYSVTFSLGGFQTQRREGVALPADFTATLNAELGLGAIEETITVTGEDPVVDTVNVRQQARISEEAIAAIPVSRRMASWAALLAGASTGATSHDVGGTQGERGAFQIHGGSVVDQVVDGMWQVLLGGRSAYSFNNYAIAETIVETSSGSAESFSGGAVLKYIYKDGGNRFSGTFSATNATGALQADNLSDELLARGVGGQLEKTGGLKEAFDVGGGWGGPILKDKLWFFHAAKISGVGQYQTGNFYNATQGTMFYTPDQSRPTITKERQRDLSTIRLTWQAAEKHRIAGVLSMQKNCECFFQILVAGNRTPEATAQHIYTPAYISTVTWTYPASNRWLLEAAWSGQAITNTATRQPEVGPDDIAITDVGLNLAYNARAQNTTQTGSYTINPEKQLHERFSASYVTGTHNFKVGGVLSQFLDPGPGIFTDPNQINGARSYTFRNRVPESVTLWAVPHGARRSALNTGLFAQDQWTINQLTLNMGLRYQTWSGSTPEQVLPAGPFVPERRIAASKNNPNFKNLNPRVGAAYDVFGNGRTAIKASLGRYVELNRNILSNPVLNMSLSTTRSWTDANGNYVPDCDLRNPATQGECGPWSDLGFGQPRALTTRYAEDAQGGFNNQEHNWQGSVSLQHQLGPDLGLNVSYYRTWWGGFLVTDNLAVTPADFDEYCITAPVDPALPTSGKQLCGLYDVRPNKFGLVDNLVTQASNYGDLTRVYNGVDFTLDGRFGRGGFFRAGLSMGQDVENNCLVVDSPEGSVASAVNNSGIVSARDGFCNVAPPWSAGTQLKSMLVYPLPWGLRTSFVYQNIAGIPYGASYVVTAAQVAPSLGRPLSGGARSVTKELVPAQTLYENRLQQLDVRLSRIFPLGRGARATANVDLYNVFNEDAVLSQNTAYGSTWRQVRQVMGGRLLRFTAQFDF